MSDAPYSNWICRTSDTPTPPAAEPICKNCGKPKSEHTSPIGIGCGLWEPKPAAEPSTEELFTEITVNVSLWHLERIEILRRRFSELESGAAAKNEVISETVAWMEKQRSFNVHGGWALQERLSRALKSESGRELLAERDALRLKVQRLVAALTTVAKNWSDCKCGGCYACEARAALAGHAAEGTCK